MFDDVLIMKSLLLHFAFLAVYGLCEADLDSYSGYSHDHLGRLKRSVSPCHGSGQTEGEWKHCTFFTGWSSWSSCTGSCGGGTRGKERRYCCPWGHKDGVDCAAACNYPERWQEGECTRFCPCNGCKRSDICYPGTCSPTTCTCDPYFGGDGCRTILVPPSILKCSVEASGIKNGTRDYVIADCIIPEPHVIKATRIPFSNIQVDWSSLFEGPNDTTIKPPNYITQFKVGVIEAYLEYERKDENGNSWETIKLQCDGSLSEQSPGNTVVPCDQTIPINGGKSGTWKHGESVYMKMYTKNGGKIDVRDATYSTSCNFPYAGKSNYHSVTLFYDIESPINPPCPGCNPQPVILDVGPSFIKENKVRASWRGWSDYPAGLGKFEASAYKLEDRGGVLKDDGSHSHQVDVDPTGTFLDLDLPEPGLYAIILTVEDKAEPEVNYRLARRFVLFDNVTTVTVNENSSILVESANANTLHVWLTSSSDGTDSNADVTVSWRDYFENSYHDANNLLAPIDGHSSPVDPEYDLLSGQPPLVRSAAGIPHVKGIYKFLITAILNPINSDALQDPASWTTVTDIYSESETVPVARSDGDAIAFVVRGYDMMENFYNEYVFSYVDTSPPVIENIGLMKDGVKMLTVHNSEELFDMTLAFEAFDFHSGLIEVHWELSDMANSSLIHGSGHESIKKPTVVDPACPAPWCYCTRKDWGKDCFFKDFEVKPDMSKMDIPEGNHDYDYMYTITVKNAALFTTTVMFQITIDTSPPIAGTVIDNEPGDPNVDYQQSFSVHASWSGFFDPQSGIHSYEYAFSNTCLSAEEFGHTSVNNSLVHSTIYTFTETVVPGPGQYHCTVVAYNNALLPSSPVCSTGVMVDITPPRIKDVRMSHLMMHSGLAKDTSGQVWYIDEFGERVPFNNSDNECNIQPATLTNVDVFPEKDLYNHTAPIVQCKALQDPLQFYTMSETQVELSWLGVDRESDIFDYEIGLSTAAEDLDLMPYQSTEGHPHFVTYHPGLSEEDMFYVHLKAINRAGMETVVELGPILVNTLAPEFEGDIYLTSLTTTDKVHYLVASWNETCYSSTDLALGMINQYKVALGSSSHMDDILHYHVLDQSTGVPGICEWSVPPLCAAIPVDDLAWNVNGRHVYYFSLKLAGANGLITVVSSSPYEHVHGPPKPGVVLEIPLEAYSIYDISHQTNTSSVRMEWYGFTHPDQAIRYLTGFGSSPCVPDIKDFEAIEGTNIHQFDNLNLQEYQTYFSMVLASTEDGSVCVASSGITILPLLATIPGFVVYDGSLCQDAEGHPTHDCDSQEEYHTSVTTYSAHWRIPEHVKPYVGSVEWGLQELRIDTGDWEVVREPVDVGLLEAISVTDVHLEGGRHYRSSVALCNHEGCYQAVFSPGILVVTDPLIESNIEIAEVKNDENGDVLEMTWHEFINPYNEMDTSIISHYEFNILIEELYSTARQQLWDWVLIPNENITRNIWTNELSYEYSLAQAPAASLCFVLAIRGYNKVGMYSTSYKDVSGCDNPRQQQVVIDAVGSWDDTINDISPIHIERNDLWGKDDQQYTPSRKTISAVWPSLRHPKFYWTVAVNTNSNYNPAGSGHLLDYNAFSCESADVLACGETEENYVNVHDLELEEGKRYHVCINANATTLQYETFDEELDEVTECSSGVVVDLTPPLPGRVWIGDLEDHTYYQTDRLQLRVYWEGFSDVEEHGSSMHESGIVRYEYALGSNFGAVDILSNIDVGQATRTIVTNLSLKDGIEYFITVTAYDYVGRFTSVTSDGVTIDTTPPNSDGGYIDTGGNYIYMDGPLPVSWHQVFQDLESGINLYAYCAGSKLGFCDVDPLKVTEEDTVEVNGMESLSDGQECYISVQCMNKAGLTSVKHSSAVIADRSPPLAGFVLDVDGEDGVIDINYQTESSRVDFMWGGFHDPHTPIVNYFLTVRSCATCPDLLQKTNVGLRMRYSVAHADLVPGDRYHAVVEACNAAALCITAASDGVILDTSPPVLGFVFDGISGHDIDYQSQRTTIDAHWLNVHDLHSGISHMEWWAGTEPGAADVMPHERLHTTDKARTLVGTPLPVNKLIYVTLRVYNRAGLYAQRSSDGFLVDVTPPFVTGPISIDMTFGSITANSHVWKSAISVLWDADDDVSPVKDHYISINTKSSIRLDVPTVKILGDVRNYTFTNVSLNNGEEVYVSLKTCNAAKLCNNSQSPNIMVDYTPPSVGAFAVETEHAAQLERGREGLMTYHNDPEPHMKLAWLGFMDPQSDIDHYGVTVGTSFVGSEFIQEEVILVPQTKDEAHGDEGYIQNITVPLARVVEDHETVYISVQAVNKVGLISQKLHGSFEAIPALNNSGSLYLDRRCGVISCAGHCTCAPSAQICSEATECADVSEDIGNIYSAVSVRDVTNYVDPHSVDEDFTISRCALAARWSIKDPSLRPPVAFEWSVGHHGSPPGSGLFDTINEQIWKETGNDMFAVFTTHSSMIPDLTLKLKDLYVFYVRAWYDDSSYAVYSSDGIETDYEAPIISSSWKVIDIFNEEESIDVDYSKDTEKIGVSWVNVFRDPGSGLAGFTVTLGSCVGCGNIASVQLAPNVTTTMFTGLALQEGIKYVSTVVATNMGGLQRMASSNGFMLDLLPPEPGTIWDGYGRHDEIYTKENDTVCASWHGFFDTSSGIEHYELAFGTLPLLTDLVPWKEVGLNTRWKEKLDTALEGGSVVFASVVAVDAVGWKSSPVSTNGILIDHLPPQSLLLYGYGPNLLDNPYFEDWNPDLEHWETYGVTQVNSISDMARKGKYIIQLRDGYLHQSIHTKAGKGYWLKFYVTHAKDTQQYDRPVGNLLIPGSENSFMLPRRIIEYADETVWIEESHYFIAKENVSTIRIEAIGKQNVFYLDDFSVCESLREISQQTYQPSQVLQLHVSTTGEYSTVSATWEMFGPQSPVVDNSWAIGTVRGGVQIQTYRSVGSLYHARRDFLKLGHKSEVHVSVVVTNAAGLRTSIHSEPQVIDLTPPNLCCLKNAQGAMPNFVTSGIIDLSWEVNDDESGVDLCEIAVGFSPGSQEIESWKPTDQLTSVSMAYESSNLSEGSKIYTSIRCQNGVGLRSRLYSGAMLVVSSPPLLPEDYLRVLPVTSTHYHPQDRYQADNNTVTFTWSDVTSNVPLTYRQVVLYDEMKLEVLRDWQTVGSSEVRFGRLTALRLDPYKTYSLGLRAINVAGLISDTVYTDFTVETNAPVYTENPLSTTWLTDESFLVDWDDAFSSWSEMTYEITMGSNLGGNDIFTWTETKVPVMTVEGVSKSIEYYLTITAINKSGLYCVQNFVISYN